MDGVLCASRTGDGSANWMIEEAVEEFEFDRECEGLRHSETGSLGRLSRPRVAISCTKEGRAVIAADDMGRQRQKTRYGLCKPLRMRLRALKPRPSLRPASLVAKLWGHAYHGVWQLIDAIFRRCQSPKRRTIMQLAR